MKNRKRNFDKSCQFCLSPIIPNAKFCGKCGNQTEFLRSNSNLSPLISYLSSLLRWFQSKFAIAGKFSQNLGRMFFVGVLTIVTAGFLVFALFSYKTYASSEKIHVFSDIPLNHPVYKYCDYLISIQAIKTNGSGKFDGAERISVADWNYMFKALKEAAVLSFSDEYLYEKSETMSNEDIKSKTRKLANKIGLYMDSRELDIIFQDTSRLNVYCFFNQIFAFKRDNSDV